jgi:hypothetical protein
MRIISASRNFRGIDGLNGIAKLLYSKNSTTENNIKNIMRLKAALLAIALCSFSIGATRGQGVDYLSACWQKQCAPFNSKSIHLTYIESLQQLYISAEPWQTTTHVTNGSVWFNTGMFEKSDSTFHSNGKVSVSNSALYSTSLLVQTGGDTTLAPVTKKNWFNVMFESARYSPVILLSYFHQHQDKSIHRMSPGLALYSLKINKTIVTLAIRLSDTLVESVRTLEIDDLIGDAENNYRYRSYSAVDGVSIPDSTETEKADGKLQGGIRIRSAEMVDKAPTLIAMPANFKFTEEKVKEPDVRTHKYSDHIHLIDLIHADCRSMVVEFADFLLVVDAPLPSRNGELIIEEARKIAPDKPIKYFAFGHHHSSFVGGVRPFIAEGATILTRAEDTSYLNFLASEPHSLDPDDLYLHPRPLHTQEIGDSLTISDGNYQMKIYYIGKKSRHSDDYVLFYFPKENVVWDDDLAWVKQKGGIERAIDRQEGLVKAIEDLKLHPKTVIQSWPLVEYGIKTLIPYADLQASMKAQLPDDVHQ